MKVLRYPTPSFPTLCGDFKTRIPMKRLHEATSKWIPWTSPKKVVTSPVTHLRILTIQQVLCHCTRDNRNFPISGCFASTYLNDWPKINQVQMKILFLKCSNQHSLHQSTTGFLDCLSKHETHLKEIILLNPPSQLFKIPRNILH